MNRFRCQYQHGKICVSDTIECNDAISSAQILMSLAKLAIKVKNEISNKKGKKVAYQILHIHKLIIKSVHGANCIGNGDSRSFYFNKKGKCNERIDIEIYGEYGRIDNTHPITEYISKYRKLHQWSNLPNV